MPRYLLVLASALAIGACSASGPVVAIEGPAGSTRVRVEVADTDGARQRGLMGRTSLAEDQGMLFVWSDDTTSAFWMKDTPLPLSVAFIDSSGRIVRILDMEPCRTDPCPVYDPSATYRTALEVRQGAFAKWGVREGDTARLLP